MSTDQDKSGCRKCGGEMRQGIAMAQTWHCGDEGTCSPAGPGKAIECMKCSSCGWSVTGSDDDKAQPVACEREAILIAQRDAWKTEAASQYGLLRIARYGHCDADYPVTGALDAYARGKYPALSQELPVIHAAAPQPPTEQEPTLAQVDAIRKAVETEMAPVIAQLQREHDGAMDERNEARQDLEAAQRRSADLEALLGSHDHWHRHMDDWQLRGTAPTAISFHGDDPTNEVMRLDHTGMTYKGQRIEDGGEAHRAFMEVMALNLATPQGTSPAQPDDKAQPVACPLDLQDSACVCGIRVCDKCRAEDAAPRPPAEQEPTLAQVDAIRKAVETEMAPMIAQLQHEHDGAMDERNEARQDLELAQKQIADLRESPQPPAEPMEFAAWRRILAEKVDAYIQGESDGEGAGEDAYDDLKAHILTVPVAQPPAEQGAELSEAEVFQRMQELDPNWNGYGNSRETAVRLALKVITTDRAARGGCGMTGIFDTPPQFVNELGVKWWRDEDTTRYAQKPDAHGTTLDAVCYFIEEPGGRRTRVLVAGPGGILEEDQTVDGMGVKIEVRKFLKRDRVAQGAAA